MAKTYLVFFLVYTLLFSTSVWSNENSPLSASGSDDRDKPIPCLYNYPTGSCIDRCHVNYMAYQTLLYQGEVFRHKTHSPEQHIECYQCHNDDPVEKKTHGDLVIQKKDCWDCHHKETGDTYNNQPDSPQPPFSRRSVSVTTGHSSKTMDTPGGNETQWNRGEIEAPSGTAAREKEDCLKCHADVKTYIDGNIPNVDIRIPDWMSMSVSCADCHKPEHDTSSFQPVRDRCIECHNHDYGLLYDARKETINSKIGKSSNEKLHMRTATTHHTLQLVQSYGMHNFRLSQTLLRSPFYNNHD